jgi:4a-hydroxytetrahydrobiopterin dehydratase
MDILDTTARNTQLTPLLSKGWAMVEGRDAIHKTFGFGNFRQAFAWMTEAALWAEKLDHHPEWCNVYNEVTVTLQTHSAGGLTMLDIKLATRMEAAL